MLEKHQHKFANHPCAGVFIVMNNNSTYITLQRRYRYNFSNN